MNRLKIQSNVKKLPPRTNSKDFVSAEIKKWLDWFTVV